MTKNVKPKKKGKPKDPVREAQVEEIMEIMRQVVTADGKPSWTTKVRKELGKKWGRNDSTVRNMSAEASKRVIQEGLDRHGNLNRLLTASVEKGVAEAMGRKDYKGVGILGGLGVQLSRAYNGDTAGAEVKVAVKAPTPADAAKLSTEIFGDRFKKAGGDSSPSGDAAGEESSDDSGSEGGSS